MHFSVLMSLYKKENPDYLNECLESLFKQTLQAEEIIIVYDGPITTELEKVVDNWSISLPIIVIKLQHNVGLGMALNEGISYCSNEIIARMDTDDICNPERFNEQIKYLINNPKVAIVGSHIEEFEGDVNHIISQRYVPLTTKSIIDVAKKKNPFNHMTVVFRKSEIIKAGGYKHHYLMEDYNLWLRLLAENVQAANIPRVLVYVRGGENMLQRRIGVSYIKSEYALAKIKFQLGYQSFFESMLFFGIRSMPRLLPIFLVRKIYTIVRKN